MSGRKMKQLRREGLRKRKPVQFLPSDDKTNYAFDPVLYRERRNRGLRGTITPVTVHQPVYEDGKLVARIPIGGKSKSEISKELKGVQAY